MANNLLTNLLAHWALGEASGNRVDSHTGGYTMAAVGTPGNRAGKIGNALDLTTSASNHLKYQDTGNVFRGLSTASRTIAFWVLFDALPGAQGGFPVSRWTSVGDWTFSVTAAGACTLTENTTGGGSSATTPDATIATGSWYLVVGWYDHTVGTNGTVYVQVNDGTVYSTALAAAKTSYSNTKVAIGDLGSTDVTWGAMDGGVDEVAIWSTVLSAAQRTALYNGGAGLAYASFDNGVVGNPWAAYAQQQ